MLLRSCLVAYLLMLPSSALAAGDAPPSAEAPPTPPQAASHPATEEPGPTKPAAAEEAYKPPFPEREELFQPPSISRPAAQRQDSTEVALKGFIDVNGQKVVLAVNGGVKQLAAGESAAGVEVIRIDPPKVTLQRGRVRWTETLFEIRPSVVAAKSSERLSAVQALAVEAKTTEAESLAAEPPAGDAATTEPAAAEPGAAVAEPEATVAQPKVVQPAVDQPAVEPASDEAPAPPWVTPAP